MITLDRLKTQLRSLNPRRICLIKPSALGDVVQSISVVTALRHLYEASHISWIVNRPFVPLIENHPHLDEVIPFERPRGVKQSFEAYKKLRRELSERSFDLVVDLQGLLRSGLMAHATQAPVRIGLGDAREGSGFFYTHRVHVPRQHMSAVDKYWLIIEALGGQDLKKEFYLPIHSSDTQWCHHQFDHLPRPRILINPGARWITKRWPAESYADAINRVSMQRSVGAVIVGSPDEQDIANDVSERLCCPTVNLAGKTSLHQLAAIIAESDLVVTNDSGPMHMAAALDRPTVALFTCTAPERARPYGEGHTILTANIWCAASYIKTCNRLDCMSSITPTQVADAIVSQLDRTAQRRAS